MNTAELDGEFDKWQLWCPYSMIYDCCSASVMEKWPSLSQTILRISESILGLDFNQMSYDTELLASNSSRACATWTFCKIIFHKVWKGWSKLQGDSLASLRSSAERYTRLFDVHLKCAVSSVCVFLTNALRSHYACGLGCGGFINVRCEPHYGRLLLF